MDIQLTETIFLSRERTVSSSPVTVRVIKSNVVIKFRRLADCGVRSRCRGVDTHWWAFNRYSPPRQESGRSENRQQWLFELYIVPCAANQQRDFIHAIDHKGRFDRYSDLTHS